MIQGKALFAEKGCSHVKDSNAALNRLVNSLRASREGGVCGVASLGKGSPLPARRALRLTPSRLAEPINIMLEEY